MLTIDGDDLVALVKSLMKIVNILFIVSITIALGSLAVETYKISNGAFNVRALMWIFCDVAFTATAGYLFWKFNYAINNYWVVTSGRKTTVVWKIGRKVPFFFSIVIFTRRIFHFHRRYKAASLMAPFQFYLEKLTTQEKYEDINEVNNILTELSKGRVPGIICGFDIYIQPMNRNLRLGKQYVILGKLKGHDDPYLRASHREKIK